MLEYDYKIIEGGSSCTQSDRRICRMMPSTVVEKYCLTQNLSYFHYFMSCYASAFGFRRVHWGAKAYY